jgi:hypothetical protein
LVRLENRDVAICELEEFKQLGDEFFAESGDLMKLVGVLQGIDIHWNPQNRKLNTSFNECCGTATRTGTVGTVSFSCSKSEP